MAPRSAQEKLRRWVLAARRDPDAFAEFGFRLQQAAVHRELQAFLGQHSRALVELPRDHGKSVQTCVRVLWELGHNPSLRVKLVCAGESLALERARFLREAIAGNARVRLVFPELRPSKPWQAGCFNVKRPEGVWGPSVAAFGVGAASTGARADLLICDDIVDVRAIASRAERERVKRYFHENLINQLEPSGRAWNLFTPWHADDLNAVLKRNGVFAHFRRAVGDDLEPVWPAKWPSERLAERRAEIGSIAFARGYRLVLASENAPIRPEWVQFWTEPCPCDTVLISVDPAIATHSRSDRSAIVTLGMTADHEIRCLEAFGRRVSAPELLALLEDADCRHRPEVILFESNAAFAGVRDLLVRQSRFGPKVRGVTQTRDKAARLAALSVPLESGRLRLHGQSPDHVTAGQQELFDELITFPHGEHDDLADALATGTAHLLGTRLTPRIF